jgi:uncharacterized protein YkwD
MIGFTTVGYWRGFIRQSMDLTVFIAAVLIAFIFYRSAGQLITTRLHISDGFGNAIGFFTIWVIIEIIYYVFFAIFYDKIPEKIRNSSLNKFSGFIPGAIRGGLVIWVALSLLLIIPIPASAKEEITGSLIGGPIVEASPVIEGYIEKIFGQSLNNTITFLTVEPESTETVNLGFTVKNPVPDSASEERMLQLINTERTSQGLQPLVMDSKLRTLARDHAADMFERGYFSHNTPEGLSPFDRMNKAGIKYMIAGENLALAPDVDIAENGLMNSPSHRANILTPDFKKVGIGCMDGGRYGEIFAQEFTN